MKQTPARYFKYRDINICDRPPYILNRIDDISSGTATRQEKTYYGFDGCKYSNILYERRAFQVTGSIFATNYFDFVQAQRKLIVSAEMKEEANVEYFNMKDSYYAKCYFLSLPSFKDRHAWSCEFTLELAIPSFYWLSLQKESIVTTLSSSAFVENCGDVDTYPVFVVTKASGGTPSDTISISTRYEDITINGYVIDDDESIYIDCFNSDVYTVDSDNIKTSLLSYVDLSSVFFSLVPGKNRVVKNQNGIDVVCRHYDRFLGV